MKAEKITWEFYKPLHFPCAVCHNENAEYMVTLEGKNKAIKLPVCEKCKGKKNLENIIIMGGDI